MALRQQRLGCRPGRRHIGEGAAQRLQACYAAPRAAAGCCCSTGCCCSAAAQLLTPGTAPRCWRACRCAAGCRRSGSPQSPAGKRRWLARVGRQSAHSHRWEASKHGGCLGVMARQRRRPLLHFPRPSRHAWHFTHIHGERLVHALVVEAELVGGLETEGRGSIGVGFSDGGPSDAKARPPPIMKATRRTRPAASALPKQAAIQKAAICCTPCRRGSCSRGTTPAPSAARQAAPCSTGKAGMWVHVVTTGAGGWTAAIPAHPCQHNSWQARLRRAYSSWLQAAQPLVAQQAAHRLAATQAREANRSEEKQ